MPIGKILEGFASPVTSLVGGIIQRKAADKAAQQQAAAAAAAKADVDKAAQIGISGVNTAGGAAAAGARMSGLEGRDAITRTLGFNDPYTNAGATAVDQASALTSAPVSKFEFDPSTLGMDPGYLFRKAEADKAMTQNAAALGSLQSGGFAKALSDRTSQEASQETDKVFGRQLQTFNTNQGADQSRLQNLLSLMGFGERANDSRTSGTEAASRLGFAGEQLGGGYETEAARLAAQIGLGAAETGANLTTGAGTAQAVGTINKSNATTGMLGNISNGLQNIDWSTIFKKKTPVAGTPATGLPLNV